MVAISMVLVINCVLGVWVIFKVYTSGFETLFSDSLIYLSAFAFLLVLFVPAYKNVQKIRYLRMKGTVIEVNRINLIGYGNLPYFPTKETEFNSQDISEIKSGKWIKDFVTITFSKTEKKFELKTFLKNQELIRLTSVSSGLERSPNL